MIDVMLANCGESEALLQFLKDRGTFNVITAVQESIPAYCIATHTDLIILSDKPGTNRLNVIKDIRKNTTRIPIIYLVAEADEGVIPKALKAGADDCVRIPFSFAELEARIKAILTRTYEKTRDRALTVAGFTLYPDHRELEYGGKKIPLTTKNCMLLRMFFESPGMPVTRSAILSKCWGRVDRYASNALDSYICKVRKLLNCNPEIEIATIWGQGFRLQRVDGRSITE